MKTNTLNSTKKTNLGLSVPMAGGNASVNTAGSAQCHGEKTLCKMHKPMYNYVTELKLLMITQISNTQVNTACHERISCDSS